MAETASSDRIDSSHSSGHIRVENLVKTFEKGSIVAVDDLSLTIGEDEFIVLVGPSGCGKTTTLRCISGLERPDSGKIIIDGKDVTETKPKDRDLAFVFQNIALFPHKTVRQNIRFGLDMATDLSMDEKDERVREAAEMLGISDFLDRKPSALSGGQQQRVALGRAMVTEPAAFLLDEPFSALDANLRDQMETEVQQLQNRINKSMIFVTHDQEEAMTLGDRIVIMNDGEIQQIGTPYEIYNEPQNLFVATFIGSPSTNTLSGALESSSDSVTFVSDFFEMELPKAKVEGLGSYDGSGATLAIRPGRVQLDPSGTRQFTAEIKVIEPQGDSDVTHFGTSGVDLRAKSDQGKFSEVGQTVGVDFDPDQAWLFDAEGERLF